jgi:hypothetical protein
VTSWSLDEDGALDKIRAAVGNGRVPLAIDGVAGKTSEPVMNEDSSQRRLLLRLDRLGAGC